MQGLRFKAAIKWQNASLVRVMRERLAHWMIHDAMHCFQGITTLFKFGKHHSNPESCCTFKKQPWLYTHWYSCVRYENYSIHVSRRKLMKHSIMFVALCREKSTGRFGIGKVSRAKSWSVSNSNKSNFESTASNKIC